MFENFARFCEYIPVSTFAKLHPTTSRKYSAVCCASFAKVVFQVKGVAQKMQRSRLCCVSQSEANVTSQKKRGGGVKNYGKKETVLLLIEERLQKTSKLQ